MKNEEVKLEKNSKENMKKESFKKKKSKKLEKNVDIVQVETEIRKLENKEVLSLNELDNLFTGYLQNKVTDEDMTRVLKLICKNGLSKREIFDLTDIFIRSGDVFIKNSSFIDKHSTGGVGDKVTLIVLPILASLGVKISKMSGKALGYTGGTIDKLNSIGVKTDLTKKEFYNAIGSTNMVISSQTDNLVPLDKKVYALRDITGTTNSIALIAVSIMSKKIASGAGKILIDIKVGKGALVANKKEALELANIMIEIGKEYNREVICMLTRMDNPLGNNIGNKLEVLEAIEVLKNEKEGDLRTLATEMAALMYNMSKGISLDVARKKVEMVLESKEAYYKFEEFIKLQGGSISDLTKKPKLVRSLKSGYIKEIDSRIIGKCSMKLGAGRVKKDDKPDYEAGIVLTKNVGDYVKKGEVLCELYGKELDSLDVLEAYKFSLVKPLKKNIIIKVIK